MSYVCAITEAKKVRCVGVKHADVVQQGSLLDKLNINGLRSFNTGSDLYCKSGDLYAMSQKNLSCLLVASVIIVNYCKWLQFVPSSKMLGCLLALLQYLESRDDFVHDSFIEADVLLECCKRYQIATVVM